MVVAGLALGLTACFGVGATPPARVAGSDYTIHVVEDPIHVGDFSPPSLTIHAGQSVGWVNDTSDWHSITFNGPRLPDHRALAPGKTWKHTFTIPGVFTYKCLYHAGMVGRIVVLSITGPPPSPSGSPRPSPAHPAPSP